MELTTVPRVPILRTGHYDLLSGPADFSLEDLQAAAAAFANDPAVLAPRVRIELPDQGHLDGDGIAVEAQGGDGGPAVGWCDNLTVDGNTLYADLHVPAILAESMEWAFPSRSIEGLHAFTSATGQTHSFVATGLLLLGTSWPGVTTLPDFAQVQAEYQQAVAEGNVIAATYARAEAPEAQEAVQRSVVMARVAAQGRAPETVAAGMNVADLRLRWYGAEADGDLTDLPDSYDYYSWWVTEVRVDDDGTLFVLCLNEADGRMWRFDATISGANVTFSAPTEVMLAVVPVTAQAQPRIALARWGSRQDSRPTTASSPNHQEVSSPMTEDQRRALAATLGLSEDSNEVAIHAEVARRAANGETIEASTETTETETAPVVTETVPDERTVTVSREVWEQTQAAAQDGRTARQTQIAQERDALISAAVADGRLTPAEAGMTRASDGTLPEGWRRDLDEAPELVSAQLARLTPTKYPGSTGPQGSAVTNTTIEAQLARVRQALPISRRQGVK